MEEKINALKEFLKQCNALEAFMNGVCRRHPQLRFSEDPIRDFCLGQSYVPDWTTMSRILICLISSMCGLGVAWKMYIQNIYQWSKRLNVKK